MIRQAGPDDVEGAVDAHEAAWDSTLAPLAGRRLSDLAPREERLELFRAGLAHLSRDARVWVAERGGTIVGMAVYRRTSETVGELRDLYVIPEAWGSGVALALMEAALAAMQERGLTEAVLWVGEANRRARRFYEREGWSLAPGSRTSGLGPREVCYGRPVLAPTTPGAAA